MGAKVDRARQLTSAGLGRKALENRVARGIWHRVHRGVYAWGHRGLSQHGYWMAAVLASGESQRGIVLHRSPSLKRKGETTIRARIPVTTPRRTIVDPGGKIEPYLWRRAKRQAEFMRFELNLPTDRSRSDLERDLLAFIAQHGFPRPEVNVEVGKYEVDFLWRKEKLVVETDFFDYHRGPPLRRSPARQLPRRDSCRAG